MAAIIEHDTYIICTTVYARDVKYGEGKW